MIIIFIIICFLIGYYFAFMLLFHYYNYWIYYNVFICFLFIYLCIDYNVKGLKPLTDKKLGKNIRSQIFFQALLY